MERIAQLLEKQNNLLQEQTDAKARDEKVLAELEAAKERDKEILQMQQQTIDRLILTQQRVDAILVQNYELHEYPIPRLFVILPDTYESWDPRNFLKERFRLYFLCECDEDCGSGMNNGTTSGQLTITAAEPPIAPIRVKNRIHLAKHDGYELSRPTEFFDRYGPYVLGMLKILKHCLAVATIVAPAVALAENSVKDVMEGVKSISESTMAAVDMSINFLEQKLDDGGTSDDLIGTESNGQETDNMFENLAALEGSDLRRLDTFLRNNDQDKVLGNLYRITTEQGHVKWVCIEHYQEEYRATAMASFVQSVEAVGGIYDPHFGKVTINLKSSTIAKDFFRRLANQAPALEGLDVTLAWDFGSTDLANLVGMVAKSNVKDITIDLQDDHTSNSTIAALRPGKGRYHSLMSLFSNKNLRRLQLSNIHLLGARTSNLPSGLMASWIQSFHFSGVVNGEGRDRLANIISHCPELVDLRLTSDQKPMVLQSMKNTLSVDLKLQICGLKKLQRLRVTGWFRDWSMRYGPVASSDSMLLREFVCVIGGLGYGFVEKTVRNSYEVLEVLVLVDVPTELKIRFEPECYSANFVSVQERYFSKLTHLDLQVNPHSSSLKFLSSILPRLSLVHFGCGEGSISLLQHCNLASLKSLSVSLGSDRDVDLQPFVDVVEKLEETCLIESLRIEGCHDNIHSIAYIFSMLRVKRLYLSTVNAESMDILFKTGNVSDLKTICVFESQFTLTALETCYRRKGVNKTGECLIVELDAKSWESVTNERRYYWNCLAELSLDNIGTDLRVRDIGTKEEHLLQFLTHSLFDYTY
jgi:hypothetical protein